MKKTFKSTVISTRIWALALCLSLFFLMKEWQSGDPISQSMLDPGVLKLSLLCQVMETTGFSKSDYQIDDWWLRGGVGSE